MATLYTHKDKNIRKTRLLLFVFLVVVITLGWIFSYIYESPEILVFAVVFAVFMNIFSYWFSHKIVIAVTGAKLADEREYSELHNIVENLAITAGLPKPKVYVMQESAPNAFATGRDKNHSAVAVTTGLLAILDRNELEGVIAHELSHIGNRDMLVSTIAVVLVGFVVLLSDIFLRTTLFGGHRGGDRDNKLGMVLLVVGLALAILAPIFAQLIHLSISRKREYLADASGALLTRYPEGLANALRKISSNSQPMRKRNKATAHLFIANPFGASALRNTAGIFATHPPVEKRIRALLGK